MIDRRSVADLHRQHREQVCYGHRFDRWAVLDLAAMGAVGLGSRRLPIAVRCRVCGDAGRLQVRPPVQTLDRHRGASILLH
jgi:hypothetical protein